MKEASIISVSLINLFILLRYVYLLYKKAIEPALAMWVFFSLAVGMSLVTYLSSGEFSFWDNILNTTDLIMVILVSLAIFFMGDKNSRFTSFDKFLLMLVGLIILFWVFTQQHWISNILIQMVLVIAYIPVIKRMSVSRKNTEPFSVWIALMIAPVISLLSSGGDLASIYAIRAIACTGILLLLMVRVEMKSRRSAVDSRQSTVD